MIISLEIITILDKVVIMSETKLKRAPKPKLSWEEAQSIIEAANGPQNVNKRDCAALWLMLATGIRISELLEVRTEDIDLEARTLHIRRGKGGKEHFTAFGSKAALACWAWFNQRRDLGIDSEYFICTFSKGDQRKPGKMDSSYFRHKLAKYGKKVGITHRVSPHDFRHTFALHLKDVTNDTVLIRDALNHSSIKVTDEYLRRIDKRDMWEALKNLE